MIQKYDAIIVGTGQSGPYFGEGNSVKKESALPLLKKARFGGSCINYGCTPTKALVANAKIIQSIRQAKIFGINIDQFQIDYKVIKAQKDLS